MRTNQTTSLSFFFFSCVCVCWLLSLVQSSPVQSSLPPFNKKRLMVGLILIRQLGWGGGLNFLVYYLYSNYSPTTQLFYLTSPPSPPIPNWVKLLQKKKKKKSFGVSNFKLINLLSNKLIYLFQNQPIIVVVVVVVTFNVVFYCSYYI